MILRRTEIIIFDNDGVLIDSEKLAARCNAALLTKLGYPTTAEACEHKFAGMSDSNMVELLTREGKKLPDDFIEQMYSSSELAFETELEPIPGMQDVIASLIGQAKIAVASNARRSNLLKNLRTTSYDRWLEPNICFSGHDVPRAKPAPDLHLNILERFDKSAEQAIVVEDSPAGAAGAKEAGIPFIGVLYAVNQSMKAQRREEFRDLGALSVLDTPQELGETLNKLILQGVGQ